MKTTWAEFIAELSESYSKQRVTTDIIAEISAEVIDYLGRQRDLAPAEVLCSWFELEDEMRTVPRLRAMIREYWLAEDARITLGGEEVDRDVFDPGSGGFVTRKVRVRRRR